MVAWILSRVVCSGVQGMQWYIGYVVVCRVCSGIQVGVCKVKKGGICRVVCVCSVLRR